MSESEEQVGTPGSPAPGPAAATAPAVERGGPLLDVRDLSVAFATRTGAVQAVKDVSFELRGGEVLALVGESGSGKSVCAMTLMGLTRSPATTISGSASLRGRTPTGTPDRGGHAGGNGRPIELIGASEAQLRRVRGARMAMVFQDPQSSLNPVQRVGDQIAEQILAHRPGVGRRAALERAAELMERVEIPRARARVRAYPHELSGGMRQRAMIAMALSLGAPVLLADEPTTALDVTVQAQVLELLRSLCDEQGLGVLLITHDFGVVASVAERVAVMREGRIIERGSTQAIFDAPQDPYTKRLLDALAPTPHRTRPATAGDEQALAVDGLRVDYRARGRRTNTVRALDGVSLSVAADETLAVVGESGCGKTTLLRTIAGLAKPSAGSVNIAGADLARGRRRDVDVARKRIGMVFQDPQGSLNPRRRAGATLQRALRAHGCSREQAREQAARWLARVGLAPEHGERYPHELSGGQRQRIGIARALCGSPQLVLLDEPVSSLDASLRRGVIELLDELQGESGCAYVVVSHDLAAVEAVADRIAVMKDGVVVELGEAEQVLARPRHPYTRELLAARPRLPGGIRSGAWAQTSQPMQHGSFSA